MIYKITLTPLEKFFFGGENVFGTIGGQEERRRTYLVNSNFLPQQTTLLGMLRQQLLTQNGLLLTADSPPETVQKAVQLVGETGFSPDMDSKPYGLIEALSPVVIADETGTTWQPAPLDDREMPDNEKQFKPLIFSIDESANKPFLKNLNAKANFGLQFGAVDGQRKLLDSFFQPFHQVGITMTNRLKHHNLPLEDRKEAFYRQTFLGNGASVYAENAVARTYSFVFWVKMSDSVSTHTFEDALVYMGGERSAFKMQLEKQDAAQDVNQVFSPVTYRYNKLSEPLSQRFKRIVLLSDAYADWGLIQKHSAFAVTQTVPFRYFTTVLGRTKRFYDFKQNSLDTKQQSERHTLLQRGSVIYVENTDTLQEITAHLNDQKAFQTIGYNHFQTI